MKKLKAWSKTAHSSGTVRRTAMDISIIIAGCFLVATSLNTLIIPHKLLTGGVAGLALVIHYTLHIAVFLSIILINLPVFWWGSRAVNRLFLIYSLLGTVVLTVFLPLTRNMLPVPNMDILLAAISGGALTGAGFGLVFRGRGSTGGVDIIAMILHRNRNLGVGEVLFYSNFLIILLSLAFFPLQLTLYSIISIFVSGRVTDAVIVGMNTSKAVIIISDRSEELANRIMSELHRGVTFLTGQGAYTHESKMVINCVVNRFEIARLKAIVSGVDDKAFMYISDASEVLGEGFSKSKE
ncbi:MAG: YitT family protein [Firmicutes bacterium]|nr:YitT family protein [Bacillota bacterium]